MVKPLLALVEDSDEDFEAVEWALKRTRCDLTLERYLTGDAFIETIFAQLATPRLLPSLVLLDLNLPGMDGREVLQKIRSLDVLRRIPVVVLSTSSHSNDVTRCYEIGANSYFIKPMNMDLFKERMQIFCQYWFDSVVFASYF